LLAIDGAGEIREAYCLANAERSATAFTVDPDEHFRVLAEAERRGWAIGGVFHSHPASAAVPSRTDVARSLEPGWLHVIVGRAASATPEVRAWRIEDGVPVEELLTSRSEIASVEEGGE